jgi:hypothetical protein
MRSVSLSVVCLVLLSIAAPRGQERTVESIPVSATSAPLLDRFLATADTPPIANSAIRHLSAHAGDRKASLKSFDAVTGFSYEILEETGSGIIRSRVLRAALEAEKSAKQGAQRTRAALTMANYEFDEAVDAGEGRHRIGIHPRRKEPMMIKGSIVLTSTDADLVRVQGVLVKRPSFWTRRVEIVRDYARIAGTRLPVSMTSTADVLFVGKSTFEMRYEYESLDGKPVHAGSIGGSGDLRVKEVTPVNY